MIVIKYESMVPMHASMCMEYSAELPGNQAQLLSSRAHGITSVFSSPQCWITTVVRPDLFAESVSVFVFANFM